MGYMTQKQFDEQFINRDIMELHEKERPYYRKLVDHIGKSQPSIDFVTECVLILHLGIPQAAVVDINGSFKIAMIINDKMLVVGVKYSQWRKWANYNSFVWCIVVNKKRKLEKIKVARYRGASAK